MALLTGQNSSRNGNDVVLDDRERRLVRLAARRAEFHLVFTDRSAPLLSACADRLIVDDDLGGDGLDDETGFAKLGWTDRNVRSVTAKVVVSDIRGQRLHGEVQRVRFARID